jgi:hypothetical protein
MSAEWLSKSLKSLFAAKDQTNGETISEPAITQQNSPTPSSILNHAPCFIGVASGQRNIPFDIKQLLAGKLDHKFASDDSTTPSPFFQFHYTIYPSEGKVRLAQAAKLTALKGHGSGTTYFLAMKFPVDKVNELAAQGKLSEAIIGAFEAKQLTTALSSRQNDLTEVKVYLSPKWNASLLSEQLPTRDSPPLQRI